jgi:hypothetical protein
MKTKRGFIGLVLAVALFGCGKQPKNRHIVIMPDVSGSIDRESLVQAFTAIDGLTNHMRRGDKITIIPILGDAQTQVSGRIIRLEVPTNRQAYESDLRHFAATLRSALEDLKFSTMKNPGTQTDLLGSISVAEQEIRSNSGSLTSVVVILSDFIQEDSEINFLRDGRLNNKSTAKEFAAQLAKRERLDFGGTPVYLGLLKSNEYAGCDRSRRSAIQELWIGYFTSLNSVPEFADDGVGLLRKVISAK